MGTSVKGAPMKKTAFSIARLCLAMFPMSAGWGVVLDFSGLAGKPVPNNYGGWNWVDPYMGNNWTVLPNQPPQNPTPCAVFDSGDTTFEVSISSPTPVNFVSIDLAGQAGDSVQLYGQGPDGEYSSGAISLDGSSIRHFEEQWLKVTSLTFYFDSLYPGSTSIDNLTFEPSYKLATIFREDFQLFNSDADLLQAGWQVRHGQYPATDGGIWHIERNVLDEQGVFGVYVISNSDEEGEFTPPQYMDESLISPEIDCAEFTEVHIEFRHNMKVYPDNEFSEVFNVHISNDPAHQNWQSNKVPFRSEEDGDNLYPQSIDVSNFADGKKIKIRWRYTTNFDYWWAIDNVRVVGRPVLNVTGLQVNVATGEMSIAWDAPNGFFAVEAGGDLTFSNRTDLAAGITQKQWTGYDPWAGDGRRFYRVRMD